MSSQTVQQPFMDGKADAYLEWGLRTDFRFLGRKDERIGLLLRWDATNSSEDNMAQAERLLPGLDFADVYKGRSVCALAVGAKQMATFLDQIRDRVEAIELSSPIVVRTRQEQKEEEARDLADALSNGRVVPAHSKPAAPPAGVLFGLLDDSCAFANSRFQGAGPRVWWLWDQNEHSKGVRPTARSGPSQRADFRYGGQWSRDDLAKALDNASGDEDLAYHLAGVTGLRRRATHGTHVMDLLAGGLQEPIVVVQFPDAGIEDSSGRWLARHVLDGLHYILQCAGPHTSRIVVNVSWGPQTGPHDGSALLEEAIDELVDKVDKRLQVVFPAGNAFSSRAHGCAPVRDGCKDLEWVVPPDGRTPAFLEVWWPPGVEPSEVNLRVEAPDATALDARVGFVQTSSAHWSITLIRARQNGAMALVAINPTAGTERETSAPHGVWKISIARQDRDGDLHLYVARADHDMGARRRARASYLNDAAYALSRFRAPSERDLEAPGSIIQRAGTLNGVATGAKSHVAAGYLGEAPESRPAPYSSSGPSRGTKKNEPDGAFMTDYSLGVRGLQASGVRSGTTCRLVGTSMAAPQLARALSLEPSKDLKPDKGSAQGQPVSNPGQPSHPHRIGNGYRPAPVGRRRRDADGGMASSQG